RAGAGARDDRRAGQPAQRARHQIEGDRGAADDLAPAGADQPVLGDTPRDRADRRGQLCAQEPALAKAGVPDAKAFRSGRHFASWIGITPREDSTAGRQKLGRISRAGDEDLRRLLVIGATAVIRAAKPGRTAPWLLALLALKSKKVAAVALANKMARIVWEMMVSGETYRRPAQARAPPPPKPDTLEPGKGRSSKMVIGRSEDRDTPWNPLVLRHHIPVWDPIR